MCSLEIVTGPTAERMGEVAPELGRMIAAMNISADRAEDVLQDVYLSGWRDPPELPRADLRRWLFRVTANRCNLEHRKQRRWRTVWSGVASLWPIASEPQAAEDATQQSEQQQLIKRALASLPSQLQTILVLRYFNGVNSKEIGEILELPDSTVRSHLRRAREKLAVALKRAGLGDE